MRISGTAQNPPSEAGKGIRFARFIREKRPSNALNPMFKPKKCRISQEDINVKVNSIIDRKIDVNTVFYEAEKNI